MKKKPKFRSKFEAKVYEWIHDATGEYPLYEPYNLYPMLPVRGKCGKCSSTEVYKTTLYRPDFDVRRVLVEAKGILTYRDRCIANWMKENYIFHFVFMRDNKLNKNSKKRYSDWCKENGISYAVGHVPKAWFNKA